jgi:hypothetical protein
VQPFPVNCWKMSQNPQSPQALARKKRAAKALKANLKRRKEALQQEDALPAESEDQAKRTA